MGNLRSVIRIFNELSNLNPLDRFKYAIEALRFNVLRPYNGKEASLFGYKIHYDRFDSFSLLMREIFINLSYLCKIDTDSPVIFDIGSNIGISMLFFKKLYPDSSIYCFEPDPDTFAILEKNVKDNELKGVFLVNSAIADYTGRSRFYVPSWSSGSSSLFRKKLEIEKAFADRTRTGKNIIEEKDVEVIMCSRFIEERGIKHIDFVKIDAEGTEGRIINDLSPLLNRIDLIMMEYHYSKDFSDNALSSIISTLEKAEFIVSIKPSWITNVPEVMATYLIEAINGRTKI